MIGSKKVINNLASNEHLEKVIRSPEPHAVQDRVKNGANSQSKML